MVLVNTNIALKYSSMTMYSTECFTEKQEMENHDKMCNSKLYEYCQYESDNYVLSIIEKSKYKHNNDNDNGAYNDNNAYTYKYGYGYVLWRSYCTLMEEKMFDIIIKIIISNSTDNACDDFMAICVAAIQNNCINIIDELLNINFDINCNLIDKSSKYSTGYINAFGHAIRFGTLDTIKYLVQNSCVPNIIDNGVLVSCSNLDVFPYVIDTITDINLINNDNIVNDNILNNNMICILHCFFEISFDMDTIEIKKIKIILNCIDINRLNSYINDQFGCLNIEMIQLLEQHGITFDWPKLLYSACYDNNIKLIEYILDKGIEPNKETLECVFNNAEQGIIMIFAKYKINLSIINTISPSHNSCELIKQLEECGLDKDVIISYLMRPRRFHYQLNLRYIPNYVVPQYTFN